jgi:hypothetical protein
MAHNIGTNCVGHHHIKFLGLRWVDWWHIHHDPQPWNDVAHKVWFNGHKAIYSMNNIIMVVHYQGCSFI